MAITYTDSQIAELKKHEGNFNYEVCSAFGDKHGISARSVVSKVKALGLPYEIQTAKGKKVSTNAAKKRTKVEIVAAINDETGLDLKSLANMTIPDLELLEGYFKALAEAE